MARQTFSITREELYRLLWVQPKSELARSIGISDVALGKWCRKLRIPIPGRGFWARRAAGQDIPTPPLPSLEGLPNRIVIHPQSKARPVEKIEPMFPKDERIPDCVPVAATLHKAHPIIAATRQAMGENKPDSHGMLWATAYSPNCIPIAVSRTQTSRALRILNALLKHLGRLGASFRENRDQEFCAVVDGTPIALSMREGYRQHRLTEQEIEEMKKKERYFYGRYRYQPTGRLELKIDSSEACLHEVWRDGKVTLEDQLPEILAAFMHAPIEAKRIAEARRKDELKRREAEEKAWREREAREAEIKGRADLMAEAKEWNAWQSVVAYLDAIDQAIAERACVVPAHGQAWMAQARARESALDPLKRRLDLLMEASADRQTVDVQNEES